MSRPMADSPKPRRKRRRFDSEFKEQAARLVLDEGKSVGAVARDLDLTETALREWVKRTQADRTKGRTGLTTAERDELVRLRRALRIAEEERDILKKATALFDYIEVFYNQRRRHSTLGQISPARFEREAAA